jgi:hypothetical protein
MKVEQRRWTPEEGWVVTRPGAAFLQPQLVFAFGAPEAFACEDSYSELRKIFPDAIVASCTTGGEIDVSPENSSSLG